MNVERQARINSIVEAGWTFAIQDFEYYSEVLSVNMRKKEIVYESSYFYFLSVHGLIIAAVDKQTGYLFDICRAFPLNHSYMTRKIIVFKKSLDFGQTGCIHLKFKPIP